MVRSGEVRAPQTKPAAALVGMTAATGIKTVCGQPTCRGSGLIFSDWA
jgi:hypothetical protein